MPNLKPSRRNPPPGLLATVALLACCAVLVAVIAAHPATAASSSEEIAEAAEAVLSNGRFQTELPNDAKPAESQSASEPRWRLDLPDGLTGLARLVMWVLVVAGGVLLAIFVINEISSFLQRRGGAARPANGASAPSQREAGESGSGTSLAEADRLAREGRYGEALHMLLLDCIAQLRRLRFEGLIAPSLTSRELTSRLSLPEPSTKALTAMVAAVELSHFGGRMPGEDEYLSCRQSYLQIAENTAGTA